jgi:tetratricopeptide (TPR) repeat protein
VEEKLAVKRRNHPHWVINLRLLIGTLVLLVIAAPSAWYWRSLKIDENAAAFLRRADQMEKDGDTKKAVRALARYVQFRPRDIEQRIRLARISDKAAQTPLEVQESVGLYYQAIAHLKDVGDEANAAEEMALHARLGELLLRLNRPKEALEEAQEQLVVDPENPAALKLLALASDRMSAIDGSFTIPDVVSDFQTALAHNPGDLELSVRVAAILRGKDALPNLLNRETMADAIMDEMVNVDPRDPKRRMARYEFRRAFDLPGSDDDLNEAVAHGGTDKDVLLLAAERAARSNEMERAEEYFGQVIATDPKDWRGHAGLAAAMSMSGKHEQAVEALRRGLEQAGSDDVLLNLQLVGELIAVSKAEEAEQMLARIRPVVERLSVPLSSQQRARFSSRMKFLEAGIILARTPIDYTKAAALLNSVTETGLSEIAPEDAPMQWEAACQLGRCYAALRKFDQAALAFDRAAAIMPNSSQTHVLAADAWEGAGRWDRAAKYYRQALALPKCDAKVRVRMARALFQEQLLLPAQERNWEAYETAYKDAAQTFGNSIEMLLINANFAMAQDRMLDALAILDHAKDSYPNEAALWQSLVVLYERNKQPEDAEKALAQLERIEGQSLRVLMLRAEMLTFRNKIAESAQILDGTYPHLTPDEQDTLTFRKAELLNQSGDRPAARDLLRKLADKRPDDMRVAGRLVELAWEEKDFVDAERWEERLKVLEGEDGTMWRYTRGKRLILQAAKNDDPKLAEAAGLQIAIQQLRPNWPQGYLLKGALLIRQGKFDEAIDAYEMAFRFGETSLQSIQQLLALYYQQNRIADADRIMSRMRDDVDLGREVDWFRFQRLISNGDVDRAVDAARKLADRQPDDAATQVMLAQALTVQGNTDEAEVIFKQVAETNSSDMRAWFSLLSFYATTSQHDKALAVLSSLEKSSTLKPSDLEFVLADGHLALGNREEAATHYRAAVAAAPDEPTVRERAAGFFMTYDGSEAEVILRGTLQRFNDNRPAKRLLAVLLAMKPDPKAWGEAQSLLSGTSVSDGQDLFDLRIKALLLWNRGGRENRKQAVELMEKLVSGVTNPEAQDRWFLAQFYEAEGKKRESYEQFRALASTANPLPAYLAGLIDHLLKDNRAQDAASWLKQLEQADPNSITTMSLQVRWMHAAGRDDEIDSAVSKFLDREKPKATSVERKVQLYLSVAGVLEQVNRREAAGPLLEEVNALTQSGFRRYAEWLVRQGRTSEAAALCRGRAETDATSDGASALCQVLTNGKPTPQDLDLSDPVIKAAIQKHPGDFSLLFSAGTMWLIYGRAADATDAFEKALAVRPNDPLVLNNLAMLLAEQPGRAGDALVLVDRAIASVGPKGALLDTRGVILLCLGQAANAVEDLQQAVEDPSADSRFHLHLAKAYFATGKKDLAKRELDKAREAKVEDEILTAVERTWMAELIAAL